jgi:hypothetical protein
MSATLGNQCGVFFLQYLGKKFRLGNTILWPTAGILFQNSYVNIHSVKGISDLHFALHFRGVKLDFFPCFII